MTSFVTEEASGLETAIVAKLEVVARANAELKKFHEARNTGV